MNIFNLFKKKKSDVITSENKEGIKLSTNAKSGDYSPFFDGKNEGSIFSEPLTIEEMKELGFNSMESLVDIENGYYAYRYYTEVDNVCKNRCAQLNIHE